jgi:hypothetical protein
VINRLISGFHDCKWYCESLSVIKSGLTELPVGHAHELVHPRRPARDQGVLELLDLACVKINKPKPRRLSLISADFKARKSALQASTRLRRVASAMCRV